MPEEDLKKFKELCDKDPKSLTLKEMSLFEMLEAEYDASFGYFEDD